MLPSHTHGSVRRPCIIERQWHFSKLDDYRHVNAPTDCFTSNDSCNVNNSTGSHPKGSKFVLALKRSLLLYSAYEVLFITHCSYQEMKRNRKKKKQRGGYSCKKVFKGKFTSFCGSDSNLFCFLMKILYTIKWTFMNFYANLTSLGDIASAVSFFDDLTHKEREKHCFHSKDFF